MQNIQVSWPASPAEQQVTSYNIYHYKQGEVPGAPVSVEASPYIIDTTAAGYVPGDTVMVQVAAVNATSEGPASSNQIVIPNELAAPSQVGPVVLALVDPPVVAQEAGLDFPGNAGSAGTVRFRFTLPLDMYPATYIWKVMPRQQAGYYTTFFWGNDGTFYWNSGSPDSYYGAHPYPQPPPSGTSHKWSVPTAFGGDFLSAEDVVYDRWYTQALVTWSDAAGKHADFYWDLPDTSKVISTLAPASFGNIVPPNAALTFGDAPWNPSEEIMNGIIRGIQIYSEQMSVSDIMSEITSPRSTAVGQANMWYMNINPTPSDISDKSGAGNDPEWVGSERPGLYTA